MMDITCARLKPFLEIFQYVFMRVGCIAWLSLENRPPLLCASLDRVYHRPLKGREPYVEPHLLERRADKDAKSSCLSSLYSQAVHDNNTSGFVHMC